jgi:sugar phosphate isomerase/epimerase
MDRREFLLKSAGAAAALTVLPASCIMATDVKTGLILYTVRGEMRKDPLSTLDRVAEIGYNWLEAADYKDGLFYGMNPAVFKREVESRGMELISSHIGIDKDNIDQLVDSASEARLKYLVLPSLPSMWNSSVDGFKKASDFLNMAGEKCNSNGIRLAFHNHKIEFLPIEGQIPYDIMLKNTEPELVTFQLDIAWITGGGKDPAEYFNKYPGRFELWHIKDITTDGFDATLGEGTIDFKPVFDLKDVSGMKYFFIEQDRCISHSELESIDISRRYLLENVF